MIEYVELTWSEVTLAAHIGVQRQITNLRDDRRERHGAEKAEGGPFQRHIIGAIGEKGVAKKRNIYWSGALGDFKAKDVGKVQVRATEHMNGRLILHDDDSDGDLFILARVILLPGRIATVYLPGWIICQDGKAVGLSDPSGKNRPAYFVDKLKPLTTCPLDGQLHQSDLVPPL